jgi:FtsH-binding integral membrane protein
MDLEHGEGQQREVFTDGTAWVKSANHQVRMGFIRKVYCILMMQLLVTLAVAAPFQILSVDWLQQHVWILFGCSLMSLVLVCAMTCSQRLTRSFPTNFIVLLSFTACEGVCVGFLAATYTIQSVLISVGLTVLIVAALTVYAWTTKKDFTGCGPYLFGVLLSLIIFTICMGVLRFCLGLSFEYAEMGLNILCILLFVVYIIYDTQLIIGGEHKHQFSIDDYVLAAISLYLDIINLFVHLLQLFGTRR